jgi:hypothetical protein
VENALLADMAKPFVVTIITAMIASCRNIEDDIFEFCDELWREFPCCYVTHSRNVMELQDGVELLNRKIFRRLKLLV